MIASVLAGLPRLPRLGDVHRTTWLLLVLAVVAGMAGLMFFVDFRVPFAFVATVFSLASAVEFPIIGLGLLIAGRITSTGAGAWVRIWKFNLDLFEPSLLLALGALFVHAVLHKKRVWVDAPWRAPVAAFLLWQTTTILWSINRTEWMQDVIATCILFSTTLVILAYVRDLDDIRNLLVVWVGASMFVSLASVLGLTSSTSSQFEMSQGSRASGFGQHPNWFAMNLMYSVLIAFGFALIDKNKLMRVVWLVSGTFIFIAQMQSGSRGGTGALLIGSGICALFEPRLRRLAFLVLPVLVVVVGTVMYFGIGDSANAFMRIFSESSAGVLGKSVRESNWLVCLEEFRDTWGLGIGGGGYEDMLAKYDWWLYNSQYRYPHGIFWGMMAEYGIVGISVWAWFIVRISKMGLDMLRWTKLPELRDGADLRVIAWAMIATLIGYFFWSWVEFSYDDKPFWEYLGLYTALWVVCGRRVAEREAAIAAAKPTPPPPVVLPTPPPPPEDDLPPEPVPVLG